MGRAYLKSSSKNSTVGFQAVLMRMVSGDLLLLSDTTKAKALGPRSINIGSNLIIMLTVMHPYLT